MNKILLFILGFRNAWPQWIADSAGIWQISFDQNYPNYDTDLTENMDTEMYSSIVSVSYVDKELTQVTSYTDTVNGRATALASEPSFIFNTARDTLYIRLEDYEDPRIYTINIGVSITLSDQAYDDTVNELLYRPDIKSYPKLKEEKDPLFYGKIKYDTFTVTLNNADRTYDFLVDNRILGQVGKYYYGDASAAFSEYTQIKQAKAENYTFTESDINIKFVDQRKILSRKVPTNYLNTTDYTSLGDDYIGAPKPLVYGLVNNHMCIPLNDGISQSTYTFLIADTQYHDIYNTGYSIYVNGTNRTAQVTGFSASAGTFNLGSAYYSEGDEVSFSGYGYVDGSNVPIDNPLDIITDLFENYLSINYSALSFNTTEYDYETTLAMDIGLVVNEQTTVIDIIQDISQATGIGFILERNGLYTARSYDSTKLPVLSVYNNQWKTLPRRQVKRDEILSSVTIKYDYNHRTEKWKSYTDTTYENQVFSTFGFYENKEYETYFTNETDAATFAASIMDRSKDEQELFTGIIDDKYIDLSVVKIGEIAQIEVDRQTSTYGYTEWLGKIKCEILKVDPDIRNREVEITFRKISDIDEFEHLSDYIFDEILNTNSDVYNFDNILNDDVDTLVFERWF